MACGQDWISLFDDIHPHETAFGGRHRTFAATRAITLEEFQQELAKYGAEEIKFITKERCLVHVPNNDDSEEEDICDFKVEKAFLLIQAPTGRSNEKLEFADNQRTSEYEHFCMLYPDLDLQNVDPQVNDTQPVIVCNYDEMNSSIATFMECYGRKAKAASVYCNAYSDKDSKFKKAFLLIQTRAGLTDENLEFLDPDVEKVTSEYEEFREQHPGYCTLHPHLKTVDLKESFIKCVDVDDYDEMKSEVTKFVEEHGRKAMAASTFLYGYSDQDSEKKGSYKLRKTFLHIQIPTKRIKQLASEYPTRELPNVISPEVTVCERITVYSYKEMKSGVRNFMDNYGREAIVASVYFNGHGKSLDDYDAQLRFKNPMQKSENLGRVLEDLNGILIRTCYRPGECPKPFEVVFCQCHAHKHRMRESYDCRKHVLCFTGNKSDYHSDNGSWMRPDCHHISELTSCHVMRDPFTLKCKYSHHVQLEEHAKQERARREERKDRGDRDTETASKNPEASPEATNPVPGVHAEGDREGGQEGGEAMGGGDFYTFEGWWWGRRGGWTGRREAIGWG